MNISLTPSRLLGLTFGLGLLCLASPNEASAQSILYICGDQKGNAGIAFDHGMIDYIQSEYSGGTLEATVSYETAPGTGTSAQGLYDPDDTNVAKTYTFNSFDCVILSSTVSTHYVTQLMDDLNLSNTNLLVMSEETLVALHMVENAASFMDPADSVYTAGSQQAITQNYYSNSILSYGDNYWNGAGQADVVAWKDAAANTADNTGFFFSYDEGDVVDSGPDEFTMAGDRIFFGLSEGENTPNLDGSGVWTDTIDNDMVDDSENFDPNTHLTASGKALLDQALGIHVVPEAGTTTLSLLTMLLVVGRRRRQD